MGDVPVLGHLFGKKSHSTDKTELIVLITPLVVDSETDRVSRESLDRVVETEKEVFDLTPEVQGRVEQVRSEQARPEHSRPGQVPGKTP